MTRLPALGGRGEGWFALQVLLLAGIGVTGVFLGGAWGGELRGLAVAAGAALVVAGIGLSAVAVRDLDRSVSPLPRPVPDGVLVRHGTYRVIRHPIYTGVMTAAIGWGLVTASPVALAMSVMLGLLLDLKARREEAWLLERYVGYAEYARRTKRFVPGVY